MYTVFEEDNQKGKMYDLEKGKFETLEEAKAYAEGISKYTKEDIFIADSEEYESGNYNYIMEFKSNERYIY